MISIFDVYFYRLLICKEYHSGICRVRAKLVDGEVIIMRGLQHKCMPDESLVNSRAFKNALHEVVRNDPRKNPSKVYREVAPQWVMNIETMFNKFVYYYFSPVLILKIISIEHQDTKNIFPNGFVFVNFVEKIHLKNSRIGQLVEGIWCKKDVTAFQRKFLVPICPKYYL